MKQIQPSVHICVWLILLGQSLARREHYCERNVTVSSLVPVTKQRIIIKQPSRWKLWKNAERITEFYSTHEKQINYQVISECCSGYLQMETGLCEPICDRGCPAHASCVAPKRCQCTPGYVSASTHHNGTHYCEPICERRCANGSQCVAPNTCACKDGYKALTPVGDGVNAPCVPSCQLGDGCANGQCIDVEHCVCHRGYVWSLESHSCVQNSEDEVTELEYISSSSTITVTVVCDEGFVFYAGECRAEFFESNDPVIKDCRRTGCGPNQICNNTGSCICTNGYDQVQQKDENYSLSCRRGFLEQILSMDQAVDDKVIVGFIGGKRRWRRKQENEYQPKEPVVQCDFTRKSHDVDEWDA